MNPNRHRHAFRIALAMAFAVAGIAALAYLNAEGRFGPTLCWPKRYQKERAKRILSRDPRVVTVEHFLNAIRNNDLKTVRALAPEMPLLEVEGPFRPGGMLNTPTTPRIDWRRTWASWLATGEGEPLPVQLWGTMRMYGNSMMGLSPNGSSGFIKADRDTVGPYDSYKPGIVFMNSGELRSTVSVFIVKGTVEHEPVTLDFGWDYRHAPDPETPTR